MPYTLNDYPWELFIDIANTSHTGNRNPLMSNNMSFGIIGTRGIKTSSPLYFLFTTVASIVFLFLRGGNSGNSSYLKYSFGKLTSTFGW